jgi:hypothetical protein
MLSTLKLLRSNRLPKANIAGLSITEAQAHFFLAATLDLIPLLNHQLGDIHQLNRHHPCFPRHLKLIQERQFRFQTKMVEVIKVTKESTEPWVGELMDGHEAVLRKVKQCNRMSDPQALGWKGAALEYWPLIADSYELVLPSLERLLKEVDEALANKEVWFTTACNMAQLGQRVSTGWFGNDVKELGEKKAVTFDKEVKARCFEAAEEPEKVKTGGSVVMSLTNDRKRTVGKFKKTKSKGGRAESPQKAEVDSEEQQLVQEQDRQFRFEYPPMPL